MYLQWPILYAVLMIVATCAISVISPKAGLVAGLFAAIGLAVCVYLFFFRRKRILSDVIEFSSEYAWAQRKLLNNMVVPYAMADENGYLLWMNEEFSEIIGEDRNSRKSLTYLFGEIKKEDFAGLKAEKDFHVKYGDYYFHLNIRPMYIESEEEEELDAKRESQKLLAVYIMDETQILKYEKMIDDERMVCGIIYLDNYDEALESVEEVRRSLLTALIDRKITKYIASLDGIVRKMEKDKYFFVIKQKYISDIQDKNFAILEDVKTVNIGNEMAVTLSIGMGMNGDSYAKDYEYARTAMDMALGRGGDQAVVKDGSKIRYYGGKSQRGEKNTRVKARVKAHAMKELLGTKDKILIMGHKIGDIDSFGASIGIYRIATSLNKKARIVINGVNSSVKPTMARFQNSSEYPEDMFLSGEKAAEWVDANTMLVVVDVNRPSITEGPELLKKVRAIVVLDHHRQGSEHIENATLSYVEPYASSACEMVAEILQYISDDIKIRPVEADAMYAGIVIDTRNFTNQAGVRTFEAAAFLRRNGADVVRVRKLFRDKLEDYQAKAQAIQNAEIYRGVYAISECSSDGLESPSVVAAQAANELLDIVGIEASFVMTKKEDVVYLSARSIDEVNVQIVMERLGGGGHRTIAGAQIKDKTTAEVRAVLKETLDQMLGKGEI